MRKKNSEKHTTKLRAKTKWWKLVRMAHIIGLQSCNTTAAWIWNRRSPQNFLQHEFTAIPITASVFCIISAPTIVLWINAIEINRKSQLHAISFKSTLNEFLLSNFFFFRFSFGCCCGVMWALEKKIGEEKMCTSVQQFVVFTLNKQLVSVRIKWKWRRCRRRQRKKGTRNAIHFWDRGKWGANVARSDVRVVFVDKRRQIVFEKH